MYIACIAIANAASVSNQNVDSVSSHFQRQDIHNPASQCSGTFDMFLPCIQKPSCYLRQVVHTEKTVRLGRWTKVYRERPCSRVCHPRTFCPSHTGLPLWEYHLVDLPRHHQGKHRISAGSGYRHRFLPFNSYVLSKTSYVTRWPQSWQHWYRKPNWEAGRH